MSEPIDPLEKELSALHPREVSPALRRRIGERLADPARARWRIRPLALAGGLAAAALAVVLFRGGGDQGPRPGPGPIVVKPRPAPSVEVEEDADDSEPTLLAYERALARSPEDLNALLSHRAASTPGPDPEPARIGVFLRSDASLRTLLGAD
jgi:hypothetical protein